MTALAALAPPSAPPTDGDLELIADGPILDAFHAAERLRSTAAVDPATAGALLDLLVAGDSLAAMLGLRGLSVAPGLVVDHALAAALDEPVLAEQAAWALAARRPVTAAVPGLARLVASGGFPAMPAQLALERWGGGAGARVRSGIRRALARTTTEGGWSRLAETLSLANARSARRSAPARPVERSGGIRVAQILLRGHVDAALASAGAGDGGGIVTLLVQLAAELGRHRGVERSLLIARPRDGAPAAELLGGGAAILRLPYGPGEDVPVEALWEHRAQIERALAELLRRHPIDVAHLRYADAGTFAAARALRRAGVRIAFTLAPDPHALIAERERRGELSREAFAALEASEHHLFRMRLVESLMSTADHLVTLPRAGGEAALERLLGRPLPRRKTSTIAEGIAVRPFERAGEALGRGERPRVACSVDRALGAGRSGLPLIVSAGRFHPVKGFPRLVEAWAGDPELVGRFNLVLAGGELARPTTTEREVLAEIEAVVASHPAARGGLVLLGAQPHAALADLLALARHGVSGTAAGGGIYACASAKEEFGVAILEAMASGLPVVAPDGGGPATYVEEGVTGTLVDPGSAQALRDGLRRAAGLAGNPCGATAAERLVRERFSITRMAAELADAYGRAATAAAA